MIRARDRSAERVLEPVERDVQLLERVVEVLGDEGDRAPQGRHGRDTFLSPSLVSSIKDERPSSGFRRRLICFLCSSRPS